ncbi:arginine--tRNA ligase, partial [Undibacterium luofuense]
MLAQQKQEILQLLQAAVAPLLAGTELQPVIALERPRDPAHGDAACNIAMQIAKPLRKNPREVAQQIADSILAQQHPMIAAVEIAGPGFINLRISTAAKQAVAQIILRQGSNYGRSQRGAGKKVVVEFVSANPTGPLHVGHGRQAALGDALSALLDAQGFAVSREFYYNDAGVQIGNLALSVQARAKGFKPGEAGWPESAYNGDYIAEIAEDFLAKKTTAASDGLPVTASGDVNDIDSIRAFAVAYLRREQDTDLQAFGVKFDTYYLESSLYTDGKVEGAVNALIAAGKTYEQDGALWLRTTEYKDDKDRVMRKTDGTYTYFVPDVAYHVTKWERGYQQAINIQGSDHHGTIARVRAGLQALNVGIP